MSSRGNRRIRKFSHRSFVSINDKGEEILALFAMEIEAKDLTLHIEHIAPCILQMNEVLAEVVVKNLIQNSIRHNLSGGEVSVWIGKKILKIQNSGPVLKVSASKLFERFYRDSESEASIGLGLAMSGKFVIPMVSQ